MSDEAETPENQPPGYEPAKIWTWDKESGGRFAAINRPIAGPTHDKDLPVGEHPIQLYSLATPNGVKATVMLEELLALGHEGAEYDAWIINIGEGNQFSSGYVDINPNSKIPVMVDRSVEPHQRVFESGSILLYLAEKFGEFLPSDHASRTEALNWLFWQMGSAPYLGGGFGHFYAYAPMKMEYPIDRFAMEVKRQMDVLDRHLAEHDYMAGSEYSIADMASWPWILIAKPLGQSLDEFPNVSRWRNAIKQRPAVQKGVDLGKEWRRSAPPSEEERKILFNQTSQSVQVDS